MMRRSLSISLLVLFLCPQLRAQTAQVRGTLLDGKTRQPLVGAHVRLAELRDTSKYTIVSTDKQGTFTFTNMRFSTFVLTARSVGHEQLTRNLHVDAPTMDLGVLSMREEVISLGEVLIQGKTPPAVQKGDTTEFNARAFKTNPDATAEELVAKMPGVTVEGGTVKAQGEDVQRVLVDGRPFFGNDPTLALRTLPSETIEKIQIFDKLSEQAEFTGFDDGQSQKTMNIVTRPERRSGQFGKTFAGYGNDGHYSAGGNVNLFGNETRLSIIAISNNVNQQNFSMQDLLGVVGSGGRGREGFGGGGGGGRRGPRGFGGGPPGGGFSGTGPGGNVNNFLVGQQNGITRTHSLGANYSDKWWEDLAVTQSYFFNAGENDNRQRLRREYLASSDSSTIYDETANSGSKNYNHRVDGRWLWTLDSANSLIVQPQLYFQDNRSTSTQQSTNSLSHGTSLGWATSANESRTSGNNLSGQMTWRHKFETAGRTLSLDVRGGNNDKAGSGSLRSLAMYESTLPTANDTVNQRYTLASDGLSLSSRLVYTEPVTASSMVQLTYNPSYSKNTSDTRRRDFDPTTQSFSIPVTRLSNTFRNTYSTHNASIGYRLRDSSFNVTADVGYQLARLEGEQIFPYATSVSKTYRNVLPSANINYTFSDRTNLRLFYRTSTRAPSITQLQNVVDNNNPLLLSTGNPALDHSYSHTLLSRFSLANAAHGQSLFVLFSMSVTNDYIGNSTTLASRDTVVDGGIALGRGAQLTRPVNLDGNWSLRSFLTYSFPVELVGSNLNLSAGYTSSRVPGLINGSTNAANTSTASAGVVLSSNVSEEVDFTLSYTGNFNTSRNSLQPELNSDYYNHTASARANITMPDGIVLRNETNSVLTSGVGAGFDRSYWLWNVSIAKKFLEGQRGEMRLSVNDVLNQNKSVNRSVTESYVEDSENNVLGRYFLATFTYTLR